MAWAEPVSKKPPKRQWRWRGRYRAHGKTRTLRKPDGSPWTFTSEAEAKREAADVEKRARDPRIIHLDIGRMTWDEWRDEWWPLHSATIEANSAGTYDCYLRTVIHDRWGTEPLGGITRQDIQNWVAALDYSPATVDLIYTVFATSLKAAVVAGKLGATPCVSIALPLIEPGGPRCLTTTESDLILSFLAGTYRMLVLVCLGTGMRWGEAAALHWQDVNFGEKTITIRFSYSQRGDHIKPTKGRRARTVPLPDWLADELLTWRTSMPAASSCGMPHVAAALRGHSTGRPHPAEAAARCRSGLVLPRPAADNGGNHRPHPVIAYDTTQDRFYRARDLAKIQGVTLHDLRDTYASRLLQAGFTIEEVAELLGDKDVKLVRERYATIGSAHFTEVAASLPAPAPLLPQPRGAIIVDLVAWRRSKAHQIG